MKCIWVCCSFIQCANSKRGFAYTLKWLCKKYEMWVLFLPKICLVYPWNQISWDIPYTFSCSIHIYIKYVFIFCKAYTAFIHHSRGYKNSNGFHKPQRLQKFCLNMVIKLYQTTFLYASYVGHSLLIAGLWLRIKLKSACYSSI